ncbi:MAG TPA: HDOD domain-containing protein [Methylophaga aminisulfidivorans]|uniref:HDOD domain-containing protein n=2 Tax=root TaxID=1 RepID=A0A7C1VX57_9GAMM|nr:HDOD domain-containing protein [Methylophaga aminisulfidivorans]
MQKERTLKSPSVAEIETLLTQAINDGFIEVPMLPVTANKALSMANDPNSNASDMAKLIESDPALAGHVMRIANSAAYTPMSNLVSLQQAIARLGMGIISEIALTAVIGAKLFNTPGYESYVEKQWRHALATSLWAKEIARQSRANVEVAFLTGLLHSIGRPAIIQTVLDHSAKYDWAIEPMTLHDIEDHFYLAVTTMVVTRWEMPTLVVEALQSLKNMSIGEPGVKVSAIVSLASHFATAMLTSTSLDIDDFTKLPSVQMLNLYQDDMTQLLTLNDQVEERLIGLAS